MQADAPNMPTPNHNIRYVDTITNNNQQFRVYTNDIYTNTITVYGQPFRVYGQLFQVHG